MMEQVNPNYILQTNDDVLVPKNKSKALYTMKIVILVIIAIIVIASLLFQENIFVELPWTVRILLIILTIGIFVKSGETEYAPSPMELQFFDEYMIFYLPKRYYSRRLTRKEIVKMNYSDIKKCVYKTQSKLVHFYGNAVSTWWNYKKDGTIPQSPTETRNVTDGLMYFGTRFMDDIDIVKEIEEHSPVKVIVENS